MTDRSEILSMTNTANHRAALRAIYTDAALMTWWCERPGTLAGKLRRATHCISIAGNPRGRFGLVQADTAAVVDCLRSLIAGYHAAAAPLVEELRALHARGLTWGEAFGRLELDDAGFDGASVALLGAEAA